MTTVGIVGGLGAESTIDYYRRILAVWRETQPDYPHLVIDSLDPDRALDLVANNRVGFARYLGESVKRLSRAGADFITIAANTPHIVFDELASMSPVPMMSIVEICALEAERRGFRKLALLGTRFTMEASFYPEIFDRRGMVVVSPPEDDRLWLHARYVGELLRGDFREETREKLIALVERVRDEERVDALILGGTELPLLLRSETIAGLPTLDTTELHVRAIVKRLMQ